MKRIGNDIALSYSELAQYGVSYDNARKFVSKSLKLGRPTWKAVAEAGEPVRVLYSSLPAPTRERLPALDQLLAAAKSEPAQVEPSSAPITTLTEVVGQHYGKHVLSYLHRGESEHHARELAKAHAVLDHLATYAKTSCWRHRMRWAVELAPQVSALGLRYLAVENARVLLRRIERFTEEGCVMRPRLGNRSSVKVTDSIERAILLTYLNPESDVKLTPVQVAQRVSAEVSTTISVSSVRQVLRQPIAQLLAAKVRHGQKFYKDFFRPYVKGQRPKYSLSLTTADATSVGLCLRIGGKDTYKRPVVSFVFDVHSEALLGMAIGMQENEQLVLDAFRDMLRFTGGLAPLENQFDNASAGHKAAKALSDALPILSFCAPYNAQSKYAENYIGRLEQRFLRQIEGWVGSNIQSKRQDGKRNEDHVRRCYELSEIVDIYEGIRKSWNEEVPDWNAEDGRSRIELFADDCNPDAAPVPGPILARLIGTGRFTTIRRGYVTLQVESQQYEYEVPDLDGLIERGQLANGFEVRVRFIEDQLNSRIWLYNFDPADSGNREKDTFLVECPHVVYTQRAKAEQTAADHQALGHHLKRAQRIDELVGRYQRQLGQGLTTGPESGQDGASMTHLEAEAVLSQGYTDKELMQQAHEALDAHVLPDVPTMVMDQPRRRRKDPFEVEGDLSVVN